MVRLIVNIPDKLSEDLIKASERLGLKKSSLAKIAIDKYLKDNGRV